MLFGSVYDLSLRGCKGTDTPKGIVHVWGCENVVIDDFEGVDTPSEFVKVYGPAFDVLVNNLYGKGGDDTTSVQTYESLEFANFNSPGVGGDCINCHATNIATTSGSGFAIYPQHGAFLMDNVGVSGLTGAGTGSSGFLLPLANQYPISITRMLSQPLTDGTGTPIVRMCFFDNIHTSQSLEPIFTCSANTGGSVLTIETSSSRGYDRGFRAMARCRTPSNSPGSPAK